MTRVLSSLRLASRFMRTSDIDALRSLYGEHRQVRVNNFLFSGKELKDNTPLYTTDIYYCIAAGVQFADGTFGLSHLELLENNEKAMNAFISMLRSNDAPISGVFAYQTSSLSGSSKSASSIAENSRAKFMNLLKEVKENVTLFSQFENGKLSTEFSVGGSKSVTFNGQKIQELTKEELSKFADSFKTQGR